MELKITKEKVLEAASKCSTAKETLKTLFPEVFESKKVDIYSFKVTSSNVDDVSSHDIAPSRNFDNHFFLSDRYEWRIEKRMSSYYLIPTKKVAP